MYIEDGFKYISL